MIALYIFLGLLSLIMAGMIGFTIACAKDMKDLKEIGYDLDKLTEDYFETIRVADEVIDDFRRNVERAYIEFVTLRAKGVEDLDDIIGELGKILKED